MRPLTIRATLLLALLWLPGTMHCQLELLSGLDILSCDTHHEAEHLPGHPEQECPNDGCLAIESIFYKPQDTELTAKPSPLCYPTFLFQEENRDRSNRVALATAVPCLTSETLGIWQFVQRAALPPRAPDLAG